MLRQGAYLHDISKLSVPDAVLLKPGKLDPEEWNVMKSHSKRGYAIASSIPAVSQGVLDVILCHHERWDGRGYPTGLVGEAIPLHSRLFAVCDVYDALTSERVYKRAWTHKRALEEISREGGAHFDPEITKVFLEALA